MSDTGLGKQIKRCLKSGHALLLQCAYRLSFNTCMKGQNLLDKLDPVSDNARSTRFETLCRSVQIQVCETFQCNPKAE